ncbi:MAG TPA: winged helix-turn-helix domain-containing protein [Alphaproteobacteria bacterium]|nr:winged helix-turn-helix domain-containing protein [Alphaproteobacteria bacterium]
MTKRASYEIRKEILLALKEEPMVYSKLERKIDTNPNTIKSHCKALEEDGFVKITKTEKDPSNGKPSYKVSLTPQGLKRIKKD